MQRKESGITLFFILVFLFISSLIGVTVLSGNINNQKMVASSQYYLLAFEAAESVLLEAEEFARNNANFIITQSSIEQSSLSTLLGITANYSIEFLAYNVALDEHGVGTSNCAAQLNEQEMESLQQTFPYCDKDQALFHVSATVFSEHGYKLIILQSTYLTAAGGESEATGRRSWQQLTH